MRPLQTFTRYLKPGCGSCFLGGNENQQPGVEEGKKRKKKSKPESPEPGCAHTHLAVCEHGGGFLELFVSRRERHLGSELRNKLWVL